MSYFTWQVQWTNEELAAMVCSSDSWNSDGSDDKLFSGQGNCSKTSSNREAAEDAEATAENMSSHWFFLFTRRLSQLESRWVRDVWLVRPYKRYDFRDFLKAYWACKLHHVILAFEKWKWVKELSNIATIGREVTFTCFGCDLSTWFIHPKSDEKKVWRTQSCLGDVILPLNGNTLPHS